MAGTATPLRAPAAGGFKGKFHIRKFNISNDSDRAAYEDIRTRANKPDSGIVIEYMRDLTEVTEVTDPEGVRTRDDTWYIVVQWWSTKPESDEHESNVFKLKTGDVT